MVTALSSSSSFCSFFLSPMVKFFWLFEVVIFVFNETFEVLLRLVFFVELFNLLNPVLWEIKPPFEVSTFEILLTFWFLEFNPLSLSSFFLSFFFFFLSSFFLLSTSSFPLSAFIAPNPWLSLPSKLIFIFPLIIERVEIFLLYLSNIPKLKSIKSRLNSDIFLIKIKLSIWFLKLYAPSWVKSKNIFKIFLNIIELDWYR